MSLVLSGDTGVSGNSGALIAGTAVASTSGTSIDFTSIPSWVKRITVMFNGLSLSGSAFPLIQLGDSGGVETTSYFSFSSYVGATNAAGGTSSTSGFIINSNTAGNLVSGSMVLTNLSGFLWVSSLSAGLSAGGSSYSVVGGGGKELSATLDRVRITTSNGTDTFDAGSINILYE